MSEPFDLDAILRAHMDELNDVTVEPDDDAPQITVTHIAGGMAVPRDLLEAFDDAMRRPLPKRTLRWRFRMARAEASIRRRRVWDALCGRYDDGDDW